MGDIMINVYWEIQNIFYILKLQSLPLVNNLSLKTVVSTEKNALEAFGGSSVYCL